MRQNSLLVIFFDDSVPHLIAECAIAGKLTDQEYIRLSEATIIEVFKIVFSRLSGDDLTKFLNTMNYFDLIPLTYEDFVPAEELTLFGLHPWVEVRLIAMRNPNTPYAVLQVGLEDKNERVHDAAQETLNKKNRSDLKK